MFHFQQEVDCECRHADKAEMGLRFIEWMEGLLVRGGSRCCRNLVISMDMTPMVITKNRQMLSSVGNYHSGPVAAGIQLLAGFEDPWRDGLARWLPAEFENCRIGLLVLAGI